MCVRTWLILHLPSALADLAGGKIDIKSKIPPLLTELVSIQRAWIASLRHAREDYTVAGYDMASPLLVRGTGIAGAERGSRRKKTPAMQKHSGRISLGYRLERMVHGM